MPSMWKMFAEVAAFATPAAIVKMGHSTRTSLAKTRRLNMSGDSKPLTPHVFGTRPQHTHLDPVVTQKWQCNSPYCNDAEMPHPDNGGPTPIVQGYEPWRR